MTLDLLDAAFARAAAALEEARGLSRAAVLTRPAATPTRPPIDTLSDSLSDPMTFHVERVLGRAHAIVHTDADRDALVAVLHALHGAGLVSAAGLVRLVREVTT